MKLKWGRCCAVSCTDVKKVPPLFSPNMKLPSSDTNLQTTLVSKKPEDIKVPFFKSHPNKIIFTFFCFCRETSNVLKPMSSILTGAYLHPINNHGQWILGIHWHPVTVSGG